MVSLASEARALVVLFMEIRHSKRAVELISEAAKRDAVRDTYRNTYPSPNMVILGERMCASVIAKYRA